MWCRDYWGIHYWTGVYWCKVGGTVFAGDAGEVYLSVQTNLADLTTQRASVRVSLDEDQGQES